MQRKNRLVAEYALRGVAKPMDVAEYRLLRQIPESLETKLPSTDLIEAASAGCLRRLRNDRTGLVGSHNFVAALGTSVAAGRHVRNKREQFSANQRMPQRRILGIRRSDANSSYQHWTAPAISH
jgi:hypothetical protein